MLQDQYPNYHHISWSTLLSNAVTYQMRKTVLTTFLNTEMRVENTTYSRVFLTKLEVFGNVVLSV